MEKDRICSGLCQLPQSFEKYNTTTMLLKAFVFLGLVCAINGLEFDTDWNYGSNVKNNLLKIT